MCESTRLQTNLDRVRSSAASDVCKGQLEIYNARWSAECDKRLRRLVSYISCALNMKMISYVGDPASALEVTLHSDADFGGDLATGRSTAGVFLCLRGPNSCAPLTATSKRQTCVSHPTPEAELVAANHAVRSEGIPALSFWEVLLRRPIKVIFEEDNESAIKVITSGRNPTMRHMGRTHRVCLAWLHETFANGHYDLRRCSSDRMAADIFTKHFTNAAKWLHACRLISHVKSVERLDPYAIADGKPRSRGARRLRPTPPMLSKT